MTERSDIEFEHARRLLLQSFSDTEENALLQSVTRLLIAQYYQAQEHHEALLAALAEGFGPKPTLIAAEPASSSLLLPCGHRGMAGGPGCIRRAGHDGGHGYPDGSGEQDAVKLAAMQDKDGDIWVSLDGESWTLLDGVDSESTKKVQGYGGRPLTVIPLTS